MLTALEKDRDRRYQSAADLARDIRRYLSREPIEAKPPTTWTHAVRWIMRHPVVATTTMCIAMGVIIFGATYIGIWYANVRPYEMVIDPVGDEVRVLSRSGAVLATLTVAEPGEVVFAKLVERPDELGSGALALVGFGPAPSNPFPGALCAFDSPDELEGAVPLWTSGISDSDVPSTQAERGLVGTDFGIGWCKMVDVFPQFAGPEIVVNYACTYSARAIRILDRSGKTLYQAWHDGSLVGCYWMDDVQLLVFSGLNSEVYWHERGYPDVESHHPHVVFAIRPTLGSIATGFLQSEDGNSPTSPVWYRCLLPPKASDYVLDWDLLPPSSTYDPGRFVKLDVGLKLFGAGVFWIVDEFGQDVPETHGAGDNYNRHPNDLPDRSWFHLGDLPPVVSGDAGERPSAGGG